MYSLSCHLCFLLLLFLIGCGNSNTQSSGVDQLNIPPNTTAPNFSTNYISIPGDSDIYVGPYTCGQYRVAPDERLLNYSYVSDESYANYLDAFSKAVHAWNTAVGFELFVVVDDANCVKADIHSRVDLDWFDPAKSGVLYPESTGGFTQYASGNLSQCGCAINYNPNAVANWQVQAHEMGHCLGLGHNESDPNSLMGTHYSNNTEFSEQLIALVKDKSDPTLLGPKDVVGPLKAKCDADEVK